MTARPWLDLPACSRSLSVDPTPTHGMSQRKIKITIGSPATKEPTYPRKAHQVMNVPT